MPVTTVVNGLLNYIKQNLVARTNVTANATTGDVAITVENSFKFNRGDEVILIDRGYGQETQPSNTSHAVFEYARIKEVNNVYAATNTHSITLQNNVVSNWYASDGTSVLKTIGHDYLLDENVLYGDREVIPTDAIAITVEPVSISNEWLYLMGGLSREYRMAINVYGKSVDQEPGKEILDLYVDAVYDLFNTRLHTDVNDCETPLLASIAANSTNVIIADTSTNRINFPLYTTEPDPNIIEVQDNKHAEIDFLITNVQYGVPVVGQITLTLNKIDPIFGIWPLRYAYNISDYAILRRHGMYFYDSRIDSIDYGVVQKGSAYIRVGRLNWFGKTIEEYSFPQKSKGGQYFREIT